jgi:hypothetical protein
MTVLREETERQVESITKRVNSNVDTINNVNVVLATLTTKIDMVLHKLSCVE